MSDWNDAIEAAAIKCDEYAKRAWEAEYPSQEAAVAAQNLAKAIRKLKKDA